MKDPKKRLERPEVFLHVLLELAQGTDAKTAKKARALLAELFRDLMGG